MVRLQDHLFPVQFLDTEGFGITADSYRSQGCTGRIGDEAVAVEGMYVGLGNGEGVAGFFEPAGRVVCVSVQHGTGSMDHQQTKLKAPVYALAFRVGIGRGGIGVVACPHAHELPLSVQLSVLRHLVAGGAGQG